MSFQDPDIFRVAFGCWGAVLLVASAGLAASAYNVSRDVSWWNILSMLSLTPLALLLSLASGIAERRAGRVVAGALAIFGGVEVVSCEDVGGVRHLRAAIRLNQWSLGWTWFSAPLADVRVEALAVQGGGFEARLLDGKSRSLDSLGDHLSDVEVEEVIRSINAWRGTSP